MKLAMIEDEPMGRLSEIERIGIRAGVVKHFEITYAFLEADGALARIPTSAPADGVTRRQLFRLSAAHKLIADVDRWMRHHDARNTTSHIYDARRPSRSMKPERVHARRAATLKALEARND